jgi:uncharacterized protein (DUF983 family)
MKFTAMMTSPKTRKPNLFIRILKEKCPNCGLGEVYEKKKHFWQLPVMKDKCGHCHYYFDREPGYFLGAMYISYGLAVFQGIVTFLVLYAFFPTLPTLNVVLIILAVICLFSLKNYKLSRVIYMHIFPE